MDFAVLANSLRLVVWIARCTGQLPVIWDTRRGWWRIADWYHPQFLYFFSVLLLRLLSYCCTSYVIIMSQLNFTGTPSMSITYLGEMVYLWLRLVLAPYALVLNLRSLNEALQKLAKVDCLISVNRGLFKTAQRLTLVLTAVTIFVGIPIQLYTQSDYPSWYGSYLQNYSLARLAVTLNGLDLILETLVTIEISLASLLLQQRLGCLRRQIMQVADSNRFWIKAAGNKEFTTDTSDVISVKKLHHAYTFLCQASADIVGSLGWPVLFLSLGDICVTMFHSYGLLRYQYFAATISPAIQMFPYATVLLAVHAVFVLAILFYFGDKATEEVCSLQLELQAFANSTTLNDPKLRKEMQYFYTSVSLSPPQKISAAGFYTIGKSTVPAVLGVVVTYFVLLIQFDLSNPQQNVNVTCKATSG